MAHKLFNVLDMASTDVNSYQMTMTFNADVDNGALVVPGGLKNSSSYASVKDMENHEGKFVAAVTDELYIIDYDGVASYNINGGVYRLDLVDPRNIYVPANTPVRCRRLKGGDVFLVDAQWFASAPTVGQYVAPSTTVNGAWGASTSTAPSSGKYAIVEAARNFAVGNVYVAGYQLRIVAGNN